MKQRVILVLLSCLLMVVFEANAQHTRNIAVTVRLVNDKGAKELAEGATVAIPGTETGGFTDKYGQFMLLVPDSILWLVASYTGYTPDTVLLQPGINEYSIELAMLRSLKEVVISEKVKTTEMSLIDPLNTLKIGGTELLKAACCNLSESFETTPSVDVAFTDAVTGYKQVRLLGLAGPYTLVTQENIPELHGLAAITGLTFTPGPWIESMQLTKGTGSVVNGFESVAGQINIELLKPFDGEKWFFNLYQSSQGRTEANVNYRHRFRKNLGTNLLVHASSQYLKLDQNKDHFLDQPLGSQFNILNRWIYNDPKGWMLQAGVKFLYAQGYGGEWDYKPGDPQTEGNPWGYQYTTMRLEDWAKIARVFSSRPATSLGLQLSNVNYYQDAVYGPREYTCLQNSFYANLIFQTYINTTNNTLNTGMSFSMDKYYEDFAGGIYNRNDMVPGVFCEYALKFSDQFNLIAGLRGDYDNIYGAFATPRLHLRYAPFKRTTLRASAGRAERTANILAENIGYMASSRQINIENPVPGKVYGLNPEVAWNAGLNLAHKFKIGLREAAIGLDYYYTWFQSQVVVDINDPGFLSFYNLQGRSFANSFSAQLDYELIHNLNLRLAYRYFQVMTTYTGTLEEKPFVPANRAFLNADYATRNKWKFDYTIQFVGTQRTPGVTHIHGGLFPGGVNQSPSYIVMNAQVTKVFSDLFEVYAGCENPFNYMQHDAIIGASDAFGPKFDASLIWGPMMGRNIYSGLRYRIKEKPAR